MKKRNRRNQDDFRNARPITAHIFAPNSQKVGEGI